MTQLNLDFVVPTVIPTEMQGKVNFIEFCINSAIDLITREGITLGTVGTESTTYTAEDAQLIVMYAAWLYRKRGSSTVYQPTDAMPRMLRYALNNRLMSEKAGQENVT